MHIFKLFRPKIKNEKKGKEKMREQSYACANKQLECVMSYKITTFTKNI